MGVILDANNQTEQNQQFISFKVALGISLNVNKQVQKRQKNVTKSQKIHLIVLIKLKK